MILFFKKYFALALITALLVTLSPGSSYGFKKEIRPLYPLQVLNASADKRAFNPSAGEPVMIRFKLTRPAKVSIDIYDSRDILIRNLINAKTLPAGDNQAVWNGRDQGGRIVPDGAYVYTISATDNQGHSVISDLTDATGGEVLQARNIEYNPATGEITYLLFRPARVRIRLGIRDGGPLLRTLLDWAPRRRGLHREMWDGFDQRHVANIKDHPKLQISIDAYSLGSNTVITTGNSSTPTERFIKDVTWKLERRKTKRRDSKNLSAHLVHQREHCRDPRIVLTLPGTSMKGGESVAIISKTTPVRLELAEGESTLPPGDRLEIAYYLDFAFLEEQYVNEIPSNWTFDPEGIKEGIHYLTGILYDFNDHVGTATLRILVRHPK